MEAGALEYLYILIHPVSSGNGTPNACAAVLLKLALLAEYLIARYSASVIVFGSHCLISAMLSVLVTYQTR